MRILIVLLCLLPPAVCAHPAVGTVVSERGQCVGTLVSRRHVVTAAHCVAGLRTPITFEAEQLWSQSGQTGAVKAVEIHPAWNVLEDNPIRRAATDFAILHLAQPVRRAAYISLGEGLPQEVLGQTTGACGPIFKVGPDVALAPCSVGPGQSGTAAVQDGKLVGLVVAQTTARDRPAALIHLISLERVELN